jgi:formamidopyrimidine-DNA glycosylase
MPELPEAETIRRQLAQLVTGAKVRSVEVHIARSARGHASPEELAALVKGRTVEGVGRRGKAVLLFLDRKRPSTLIIRLGMTGVVKVAAAGEPEEKYTAGVVTLSDKRQIRYIDQRQFGQMVAYEGHDVDSMPEFADYGPEPLSEGFTLDYLKEALSRRSAMLEVVLMNQQVVAGIGKIYADEICFRAGLRPTRRANSLTGPMRERLWRATREVLEEAIGDRGTSTEDDAYRDAYGMPGNFQERLAVYQRTGEPCRVCGTPIRRTPMPGGRGMHWCPKCQK